MRWGRAAVAVVLGAVLLAGCGSGDKEFKPTTASFKSGASSSQGGLEVKSSAFQNNQRIPEKFSCKGSNLAPPIEWSGTPLSAKTVALVVTDPDAPSGTFVHWIVIGLPTTAGGSLPEGGRLPAGAHAEKNSANQVGYTGMCPPAGQTHTYIFEVLALPKTPSFPANASPVDKVKAIRDLSSHSGRIRGQFTG